MLIGIMSTHVNNFFGEEIKFEESKFEMNVCNSKS